MQTQKRESMAHWLLHRWKLTAMLTALLVLISCAYLFVMFALINRGLWSNGTPAEITALALFPVLLLGGSYAAMTAFVLRKQSQQGISCARNRISWAALPGFVVVLGYVCLAFSQIAATRDLPAQLRVNTLSYLLSSIVTGALPVLVAAMLLPVWKARSMQTAGALLVAAVLFVPTLAQQIILVSSGAQTQWGLLLTTMPLQKVTLALVAAALFVGAGRRLWDALALQWGVYLLLSFLVGLWRTATGPNAPQWQGDTQQILVWLLPALVALYCLIQWDRGTSPATPLLSLARRIRALSTHFLPQ